MTPKKLPTHHEAPASFVIATRFHHTLHSAAARACRQSLARIGTSGQCIQHWGQQPDAAVYGTWVLRVWCGQTVGGGMGRPVQRPGAQLLVAQDRGTHAMHSGLLVYS